MLVMLVMLVAPRCPVTKVTKMSDKRRYSDMDQKSGGSSPDHPPYSRLFLICNKSVTEEDVRAEFGKFGHIEEIWMVKDRVTGEHKGMSTTGAISMSSIPYDWE